MSDIPIQSAKYLPEDIQIQILSRSPVKSLLRFRCVCKRWCSLIYDPEFVQLHLSRSVSLDRQHMLLAPHCIFKPPPCDSSQSFSHVYYVGTCNGLLCFNMNHEELVVFNPLTRCYKELPLPPLTATDLDDYDLDDDYDCYWGFGFDSSLDNYKLVLHLEDPDTSNITMVFNFKDEVWRILDENLVGFCTSTAVFVNACLYWNTTRRVVVYFNLRDETFKEIPEPDLSSNPVGSGCLHIGAVRGCLWVSRLDQDGSGMATNLWELKETNDKASWIKLFKFPWNSPPRNISPMFFMRNGEILVGLSGKDFIAYHLLEDKRQTIETGTDIPARELLLVSFTESMVSPSCGKDWRGNQQFLSYMAEKVAILEVGTMCLPNSVQCWRDRWFHLQPQMD